MFPHAVSSKLTRNISGPFIKTATHNDKKYVLQNEHVFNENRRKAFVSPSESSTE